jgi:hypothetical protein
LLLYQKKKEGMLEIMNIIFWLILSIDFLIMILHYIYSFDVIKKNKLFSKVIGINQKDTKATEPKVPTSILGKIIYLILTLIIIIFLFAFLTSIVWIPILMFFLFNWQSAIIALLLILAVFSFLIILIDLKIAPKHVAKEGAIVKEAIYIAFSILLSIFIRFGAPFPFSQLVENVYLNSSDFNASLTILIPVLVIGLLITNVYLFINGIAFLVDKSKKVVKTRTKIIDILTIFTISSFFSLFFIVDSDWAFIDSSNATRFFETIDLFKNILVAVLVPLILSRFFVHNSNQNINTIPAVGTATKTDEDIIKDHYSE